MKLDEISGFKGLKQIWHSVRVSKKDDDSKDAILARHTHHYLNRCFKDWMK